MNTDFELTDDERARAAGLWLELLDAKGDAETVARLLQEALTGGDAGEVARCLAVVSALQFVFGWPVILGRLEKAGVSADSMLAELGFTMGATLALAEGVGVWQ